MFIVGLHSLNKPKLSTRIMNRGTRQTIIYHKKTISSVMCECPLSFFTILYILLHSYIVAPRLPFACPLFALCLPKCLPFACQSVCRFFNSPTTNFSNNQVFNHFALCHLVCPFFVFKGYKQKGECLSHSLPFFTFFYILILWLVAG